MEQSEVLKLFQDTGALLNGHFQLRSGLHSPQFFQCAHLLQHPRISGRLCEALVEKMKATIVQLTRCYICLTFFLFHRVHHPLVLRS